MSRHSILPHPSYSTKRVKMGIMRSTTGGVGEIVQVQGGHILRATGRKDRHSKVFTAKGPRDRRVRLSAPTAIKFYDVQDRLGYDRPSKAVDWLINKAKASIDKLAELPPWDPTASSSNAVDVNGECNEIPVGDHFGSSSFYVPESVDSQSLADSMRSFFPASNVCGENSISFQNYPQCQDLCLSLHTVQDPGNGGCSSAHNTHSGHDPALLQGSGSMGFNGGSCGWAKQHDMGRFAGLVGWAGGSNGGSAGSKGREGIHPLQPQQAMLLGQQGPTAASSHRGTLQSSFSPMVRLLEDHHNQPSISGVGHGSSEGFVGIYAPLQIHGEWHNGGANFMSNNASSSSLSPDSDQH